MEALATIFAPMCGIACASLLICERMEWRTGVRVSKMLAASAYLGAALSEGALETVYGRTILVALCCSWMGDLLLLYRDRPNLFLFGVGSFFLGHCGFAVAFATFGLEFGALAISAVLAAASVVLLLNWLKPHLTGVFRVAVPAYILVIAAMVSLSASAAGASLAVPIGALMFAISDVSVARDRFIEPSFANKAWGLPLYFAAQIVLASTV